MLADYHMHTPLCHHATGEPTDLAAQAIKIGLKEIGFSEHSPMIRDDYDDWHMYAHDLDDYISRIEQARTDHPDLIIKVALEVDYIPGQEDWIRDLAKRYPWDYFIGSVHYVLDDWDFDNPHKISRWKEEDPRAVWSDYFDRLTQSVESGLFHIIGHADLCKKFAIYPEEDCTPLFRRLLEAAKHQGMAMELNTAGLRKACKEIYPSAQIVQLAAEIGVPITFGSDAHSVGEVGLNFDQALQLAQRAGFSRRCQFTQRQCELVPL